jgi:uncharacterized membrane protein YeiH
MFNSNMFRILLQKYPQAEKKNPRYIQIFIIIITIIIIIIPYFLQSFQRHLVTFVSISLETCSRYFQWSSPF